MHCKRCTNRMGSLVRPMRSFGSRRTQPASGVYSFAKTRAVMILRSRACANQAASERWRVCARVAGGGLEAAAKTVTVPTTPEVQAMFVATSRRCTRSTRRQSQRYTSRVCNVRANGARCHRCGTLIIRVLRFETSLGFVGTAANLTCFGDLLRYLGDCCGFVGTANAFCFEELLRSVGDSCGFVGGSANPFCFLEWSRSKSKEMSCDWHCAGKVLVSWRDHSRSHDVGNLRAVLRTQKFCRGSQKAAANIFWKTLRS